MSDLTIKPTGQIKRIQPSRYGTCIAEIEITWEMASCIIADIWGEADDCYGPKWMAEQMEREGYKLVPINDAK